MTGNLSESAAVAAVQAALLSFSRGRFDEARASCQTVLRSFPERAAALHLLGIMALQAGDRRAASQLLQRAAEAPDTGSLYLLSYAELICKETDRAAALALVRRAVAMQPDYPLAWLALGDQLWDRGEYAESRSCFERALALNPALWQARAKLAMLLGRIGCVAQAVDWFAQLCREHADNAEVLAGYAALLQDLGRCAEALAEADKAILRAPDSLEYRLRAIDIEMQLGRYGAAFQRLDDAAAQRPDDLRLTVYRATLLRLVDRYDEAVELCRGAIAKGGASADLWRAYAQALHLAGDHEEALDALERAAASRPALALSERALLLSQAGRLAEAVATFDAALGHEPALADAWYNKAHAKTYRRADPDIDAMRKLLGTGSFRDRLLLHFALGKAHMDADEPQSAFIHWQQGNRMKRSITDYDAAATARQLASIRAQPVDFAAAHAASGVRLDEAPVFIVGMPRCGSSLVEQILASHPEVHGAGEQTGLRYLLARSDLDDRTTAESALQLLRRFAPRATRIVDKDLRNFEQLGSIHRILPRARIIHCRRNPLDMCFSAYTKLFLGDFPFAYDLAELGLYYREYHSLMAHWRGVLPSGVFMEIDYEALVSEPQAATRRLVDFLGLRWSDACLRFFENRRTVNTASLTQVRRPIYRSSVGRSASLRPYLQPLTDALGDLA